MATELLSNPNLEEWTDAQELLTDPGLEAWDDASTPSDWTTESSGDSTVNRDTAEAHSGTYCLRMDVDGDNANVQTVQSLSVTAGVPYTFSFYHKETGAATCKYSIRTAGGGASYLNTDGSWVVGAASTIVSNSATYALETRTFTPFFTGTAVVTIGRQAATSESIYIDDASLQQTDGLMTDGACSNWTDANELFSNPNFSEWADGTDATDWTETLEGGGTSTINMDGDAYHGDWCLRMDIDSGNKYARATQVVALLADKSYTFSFYHKETGAATIRYRIYDNDADEYLQDDGTWDTVNNFLPANEGSYTKETVSFVTQTTGDHYFIIESKTATSESIYIDACSLQLTHGLVVDGGMEVWTGTDVLDNWTKYIEDGTSDLAQSADEHEGTYAASLVVDGDGYNCGIYQTIAVTAGAAYELSFYHYESNTAELQYQIRDDDPAPDEFLQAVGTWADSPAYWFTVTHAGSYTQESIKFVANSTGNIRLFFMGTAANETYFIDKVALKALPVLDSWLELPSARQFSMIERDLSGYSGLGVQIDADASGTDAYVQQSLGTLTSGVAYELRLWGKAESGADPTVSVSNGANEELDADGTWSESGYVHTWSAASWTEKVIKFIPDETSAHYMRCWGVTASKSYYYDSISLKAIPTPDDWTVVPSKLSMIERTYDGQSGAAVEMAVDAGGTSIRTQQEVSLIDGVTYLFTIYGKAGAAVDPIFSIIDASGVELQADGTWVNNNYFFSWTDTGYTLKAVYFTAASTEAHNIRLWATTADKSYYYDTLSLTKVDAAAAPNLFLDGGLEMWTSPTGLANWVETIAGASTVNQEDTGADVAEGTYSCRLDIDGTSNGQIAQAVSLTVNVQYALSFQHKAEASAQLKYAITNASADYLQTNGTWAAGANWFEPDHTVTFDTETKSFTPDESSAHTITIKEGTGSAGKSIWVDDIRLNEVIQPGYIPKPPSPILNPAHPLTQGLVGAWLFSEGSGTQVNDVSRLQNPGTLTAANGGLPEWTGSHWGSTLDFNSQGYITISTKDEYMDTELSVELRFKVDVLPSVAGRNYYVVRKSHSGAPNHSWLAYIDSSNDLLYFVSVSTNSTAKFSASGAAMTAGVYRHVVMTFSSGYIATLYVDAVAQADVETNDAGLYQSDGVIRVSDTGSLQLDGTISYLKIYNRALSQNEVARLFHNSWQGLTP